MEYTKLPKSYEEQADILIRRGLKADRYKLIKILHNINYYRLSGYLFPFKISEEQFREETTLEKILNIYSFDRKLRLLFFDAIEKIEIKARTVAAYHLAHRNGSFGYADRNIYPRLNMEHDKWMTTILNDYDRSKETFKEHFKNKYGDRHNLPPVWMLVEMLSFGDIVRIFRSYDSSLSKLWANEMNIPDKVLESWLLSLQYIRNICAHHSRLYNRNISIKPLFPNSKKYKKWKFINNEIRGKVFSIAAICMYMLKYISPADNITDELKALLAHFHETDIKNSMGFNENWEETLKNIL